MSSAPEDLEEEDVCVPPEEKMELLFLIEFLVDTMLLKPENMNLEGMDPCLLQGQACIELIFLQYPPMSICEKDADPDKMTGGNYIKFNGGKSLMFALSEEQVHDPPQIYLGVVAHKMLPHACVPDKFLIGGTKICLTELFKQVAEKIDAHPDKLPVSKSIKDKYILHGNKNKCPTAEVTIYIRLSCLGQNVVTEFQRGTDDCDPFLFKSKQSKKVYECKPSDLKENDADLCPPLPGWGEHGGKDCGDCGPRGGKCAEHSQRSPVPKCPPVSKSPSVPKGSLVPKCLPQDANKCPQSKPSKPCQKESSKCRQNEPTLREDDDDEYDEFGAEVHGHALTIKVQKSQKHQQPPNFDGEPSRTKSKSGMGNMLSVQVPQSQNLCNKSKSNRPAVYNISGGADGKCGEPLQIVQGVDSPDKDIFLLRIGKKGEAYAKGKLELELRTPKPKVDYPIHWPKKYDKVVQTDKVERPKKGKGKKGKGKGKKK